MTSRSNRDSCTNTSSSKLSLDCGSEEDEMYSYVDITERLILARSIRRISDPVGAGDSKNLSLPMRSSLFAHVPPFIIFHANGTTTKLPIQMTKHLLWWMTKKNTPKIVMAMVRRSGFRTTSKHADNWCGTWCSTSAYEKLGRTNNYSKINHFPSSAELGDKILLWRNFRQMRRKFGAKHFDYVPLTFVLPSERLGLKGTMKKNGGFWIVKPPDCCAGTGIKVVSNLDEIPNYRSYVAQRYISPPRLIDGVKFDMRLYVLLTSIDPLRIYVYNEGLVRLATVKYVDHMNTLSDRFMHLTNTSVNKVSPNFQPNDDPDACKGNMWSLNCLWRYLATTESVDAVEIWTKIKDIAVKTVISAEPSLYRAWKRTSLTTYNFYQLFGFDVLLDSECRPWLLEVNDFPSMEPDTPLCNLVKGQLAKDYLNLVGFHVPDLLTDKELRLLRSFYRKHAICYNRQLYSNVLTWQERKKQYHFLNRKYNRKYYLRSILKSLTPDDVRVLIRHEDEIAQTGRFERIFPTPDTFNYFAFFEEDRYYNLLLDAWENEYGRDRSRGIERLRKLCRKKYHLS